MALATHELRAYHSLLVLSNPRLDLFFCFVKFLFSLETCFCPNESELIAFFSFCQIPSGICFCPNESELIALFSFCQIPSGICFCPNESELIALFSFCQIPSGICFCPNESELIALFSFCQIPFGICCRTSLSLSLFLILSISGCPLIVGH